MKDPIQITITCARPINNWLGSCRTEKEDDDDDDDDEEEEEEKKKKKE